MNPLMRTGNLRYGVWNTRTLPLNVSDTIWTEKSVRPTLSVLPRVLGSTEHVRVSPLAVALSLIAA